MSKKTLSLLAGILGVLMIILAVMYFVTPAGSLPTVLPGYQEGSSHIHIKHGIGSLLLGIACFIFAWFQTGKKSSAKQDQEA